MLSCCDASQHQLKGWCQNYNCEGPTSQRSSDKPKKYENHWINCEKQIKNSFQAAAGDIKGGQPRKKMTKHGKPNTIAFAGVCSGRSCICVDNFISPHTAWSTTVNNLCRLFWQVLSQFSSSWRIFHTPARTWFSSLQQWLPNQRLHWSLLTSLMTCQLYTESLQQCFQNLCAATTSIPCHVCCYTQIGMILRRVSSLQRSIFLCSDMDILDVCLLSETSYGGHWHLRNVGNQTSECHALYVLQVCIVDESAYQNRHVILWAMQHCTVHGQLPIRTSSLTFCVKQVRISLPLSRVVWNIVQRQLRRRQTCDARISFQECSGHVSVSLASRLCIANFACQKVTHQYGCTLHVFIQTNFLLNCFLSCLLLCIDSVWHLISLSTLQRSIFLWSDMDILDVCNGAL